MLTHPEAHTPHGGPDESLNGTASASSPAVASAEDAAILWLDMSGRVSRWTPACEQLFGRTAEEALGLPFEGLLLLDGTSGSEAQSAVRFAGETGGWDGAAWWEGADGRAFWGAASMTRVRTPNGLDIGYMVVVQDLRRLQLSAPVEPPGEEMVRLASIGRLASDVSHDIRNILAAIRGFAVLLEQHLPPGGLSHQAWYELVKACDRGSTLAQGLLGVGRQDSGSARPCDIGAVFENLHPLLRQVVPRRIGLEVAVEGGLPSIPMQAEALELTVLNLVMNARDAVEAEGVIRVTASVERDPAEWREFVRIRVVDSGRGMDPEVCRRACERAFTTKAAEGGSGLGLAIVRDAVVDAGGSISIESVPRRGTTVDLVFPLGASALPAPASATTAPPARRTSALLSCDSGVLCECVTDLLRREGIRVTRATRAELFSAGTRPDACQLVLVELGERCDPAAIRASLARSHPGARTVAFTRPGACATSALDEAGFDAVLSWPFAPTELMAALSSVVTDDRLESLN